jgi:hypothetical protein
MSDFKLPLSGDVSQLFKLWTTFFSSVGSQFGLVNINLGKSANPTVEEEVLSDVASYGRQLGRVEDALAVLIARLTPEGPLTEPEQAALADFKRMFNSIADVKDQHAKPEAKPALRFKDNLTSELEIGSS